MASKDCLEKECSFINDLCKTLSGQCKFIVHKTEVLTVILSCLTGLHSDYFKSYDAKRKYFPLFLFCNFVQQHAFAFFVFFVFLCFAS